MSGHVSVLLNEVLEGMSPISGKTVVDATFGGGGYSEAFLKAGAKAVYAIDKDPDAIKRAEILNLSSKYAGDFKIFEGSFADLSEFIKKDVDFVVFDHGMSSFQIDEAERGFSFMRNGPLDMRMSKTGESAADIVNTYAENDLVYIFKKYGEEPKARAIAQDIIKARAVKPLSETFELVEIIDNVYRNTRIKKHNATCVFQALRIFVNKELDDIENGLESATALLKQGGKLVVVTFHSLEDRIVKQFMVEKENGGKITFTSVPLPLKQEQKNIK